MTMNFNKYGVYFHDGIVHSVEHCGNSIEFGLESAELQDDWNEDHILLSSRGTITGKLRLYNVRSIKIDDVLYTEPFVMNYDDGNIYHLEIQNNRMELLMSWENYPPKTREETPFFELEIIAEKIEWENVPTLFDERWSI